MRKIYWSIVGLGAYKMSVPIFDVAHHFFNRYYREQFNEESNDERLLRKYGQNKSWAVVTGGSEGIGREFAL